MRLKWGIQFAIAAMRAYPVLFQFFEANAQKYVKSLKGHKSCCMELYREGLDKRIEFYCFVEQAAKFWLTDAPSPLLKDQGQEQAR